MRSFAWSIRFHGGSCSHLITLGKSWRMLTHLTFWIYTERRRAQKASSIRLSADLSRFQGLHYRISHLVSGLEKLQREASLTLRYLSTLASLRRSVKHHPAAFGSGTWSKWLWTLSWSRTEKSTTSSGVHPLTTWTYAQAPIVYSCGHPRAHQFAKYPLQQAKSSCKRQEL